MEIKHERIVVVTEDELDAVEDVFFCDITEEEYKRIQPLLLNVWRQLCPGPDE